MQGRRFAGLATAIAIVTAAARPAGATPAATPAGGGAADDDLRDRSDQTETVAPGAETPAAARARAIAHFRRGVELLEAGDARAAAGEFRRSFEAEESLEALIAEARALERAGDAVAALRVYVEYSEFEDDDAERNAEAQARARALRLQVGELGLRAPDPAAIREVRIDGVPVALAELPRLMRPGAVTIEIVGVEDGQRRVLEAEVRGGERTTIEFTGFPKAPTAAPPPPRQPADNTAKERRRRLRAAAWGGAAATGAGWLAVAALGGLTLDARADFDAKLCPPPETGGCPPGASYPHAEAARFEQLRGATNAMIGVSAGLAVITAGLALAGWLPRRTDRREAWRGGLRWAF